MPYSSDAQRKFFHTDTAKKAGITGAEVKEFDKASKGKELPEHVKKMADGGTPDATKEGDEFTEGIKEGVNHDSDAVKSYLSSKFHALLQPTLEGGTTEQAPADKMAEGGYPHVTFMEDQTPEGVKETTHLAKSHEEPKMAKGGFLGDLKKGALHKEMGISEDKNIPEKKLDKAANSDNETLRKRAQFAINAKKWHHAEGGVIPHEEKLNSVYKAMGIKKYADGGTPSEGDVDASQLPGGVPPPPPSGPGLMDWIKNFGSKLAGSPAASFAGAMTNPLGTLGNAAANVAPTAASAAAPAVSGLENAITGGAIPAMAAPATPPPAPAPVAPVIPPASPAPLGGGSAAPGTSTTAGMPNIGGLFNQDPSKLTQGVEPEDRQALANKLQEQQHGLGAIIAQAVAGLGDAVAAKGGKEQHALGNIFSMEKTQRDEALANFDKARQDRMQKLQLQTQMGNNALKQMAAADAYGIDEHLNQIVDAPKGTMKKDLPTYVGIMAARVAAKEKDEDLYMKSTAESDTQADNNIKNMSMFGFKPSQAQIQAMKEHGRDQLYNRAKGNILVKPSDGGAAQWIPAQNLGKAKQMDPNLQVQQ